MFKAFAHQACEAARAGEWPLDQISKAVDDFIERLARHARDHHTGPLFGCPDPHLGWSEQRDWLDDLTQAIRNSNEWIGHLTERLALAPASEELGTPDIIAEGAVRSGTRVGEPSENVFRLTADGWSLSYGGEDVSELQPLKGMRVIHALLKNPSVPGEMPTRLTSSWLENPDSEPFVEHGAAIIDLSEIKSQQRELVEELQRAKACGDETREAKVEEDIEKLKEYTKKNTDKHGRPRRLGSSAERVRKRVLKNYTKALRRLKEDAPSFAQHLSDSIQMGHSCIYTPKTDPNWKT